MFKSMEEMQAYTKQQIEALTAASAAVSQGFQQMATEMSDFSKKSVAASTAAVQQFAAVKSVDSAVQVQGDYAKASVESLVAQTTKLVELCQSIAKDAFRPIEGAIAQTQAIAKA